jgi:hypothetical protein
MNRPCIRGLSVFKKGCPEKYWDGSGGCPAWKEYTIPSEGGKPIIIKDCIDVLKEHWQFESLKLLEGNQKATESFRNGMCEEVDGRVYPKMDRAIISLMSIIQREQEDRKLILNNQAEYIKLGE